MHVAVAGRGYAERKDAAEPFAAACRSIYHAMRNSPQAAAAAAAAERLRAAGREPGWALRLDPTPALIADSPFPDAESYRSAQKLVEAHRARKYREEQRDQNRGAARGRDDSLGL